MNGKFRRFLGLELPPITTDLEEVADALRLPEKVLRKLLDFSPLESVWDYVAEMEGRALAEGRPFKEPVELDPDLVNRMSESCEVLCKLPDGRFEFRRSCGHGELEKFIEGLPGGVYIPEDICKPGDIVGYIHSHPGYPARPSGEDVKWAKKTGQTLMCIDSPASRICWFAYKPEDLENIPNIDVELEGPRAYKVKARWFTVKGDVVEEEWNILPSSVIEGYDFLEYLQSEEVVKRAGLRAVFIVDRYGARGVFRDRKGNIKVYIQE